MVHIYEYSKITSILAALYGAYIIVLQFYYLLFFMHYVAYYKIVERFYDAFMNKKYFLNRNNTKYLGIQVLIQKFK